MAEVKWIKIVTDIFDDEKILLIENMPEADSIIVIWFKLLCMAGKQNNAGVFMLNDKIAYTDEMFATIFRRPINTVRLALKTFETYGMVEIVDNVVTIPNWEKHQNIAALEEAREKNRKKVATYREKQKLLAMNDCNRYSNVTVTECNSLDKIREEKEREEDKQEIREDREERACTRDTHHLKAQTIVDLFNRLCPSLSKVTVLSTSREKAITARLKEFTVEQFTTVFKKAEASKFLTGRNGKAWRANFDWIINASNFVKVLDGNYDDRAANRDGMSDNPEDDLPF